MHMKWVGRTDCPLARHPAFHATKMATRTCARWQFYGNFLCNVTASSSTPPLTHSIPRAPCPSCTPPLMHPSLTAPCPSFPVPLRSALWALA